MVQLERSEFVYTAYESSMYANESSEADSEPLLSGISEKHQRFKRKDSRKRLGVWIISGLCLVFTLCSGSFLLGRASVSALSKATFLKTDRAFPPSEFFHCLISCFGGLYQLLKKEKMIITHVWQRTSSYDRSHLDRRSTIHGSRPDVIEVLVRTKRQAMVSLGRNS